LDDVRLLAPVLPRSKVVGIGRNYAEHAGEMGNDVPTEPMFFLKPNTSVVGPDDPVVHPAATEDLQFEGELCVVIGRICRDVPVADVPKVIYGYTVGNDVTARDLQRKDKTWSRAKGYDSFCPLGPWIETNLDVSDLRGADPASTTRSSRTAARPTWCSTCPPWWRRCPSVMTLLPGDVIMTGTPAGVGRMQPGDRVSVTIDGIGTLRNQVVSHD
jgi:2-keto-4-pentenoate hydratase/2-oxohepta-3-ene-1,7-dioic acid hydratase in catechol pathway